MITYYPQYKSFLLSGKGYSYAMYVNACGYLQHLYYGKKITEADLPYLLSVASTMEPDPESLNKDLMLQTMPVEYNCYGHGDYHEPSLMLLREDGSIASRLSYLSHTITKGAPEMQTMPGIRVADETLAIEMKDDFSDTVVTLYYTVCRDCDVITRHLTVKNIGREVLRLNRAYSFVLTLPEAEYSTLRLGGRWGNERIPEVAPIPMGISKIQSLQGKSSHETNPFLAVLRGGCSENTGECYGFQLCYSGNFTLLAERFGVHTGTRVSGGINECNFSWKLSPGEIFEAPQAFLAYSDEGLGGMSRAYADFLRDHVINPRYVYARRPLVVNNWEATKFDFNDEKLIPMIDAAKDLGIDTFVLDDGWFGARTSPMAGLGDWDVNEERLPGGLTPLIDRCKQNGLDFGLWIEPEMVNEDSDLYRAHPDWAIQKIGDEPHRGRNQMVLDFSRSDVVDYIYNKMALILKNNDIAYVKWDMNRSLSDWFSSILPADRMGELAHRYVLGVYDLAKRLTEGFSHIFFEGCCGGGGRFDAAMLYYFPQIWTSDDTDGFERTKIQWGTSICYPLSSMSCHVSVCPNHQTGRTTPYHTRGAIASLGATGYELDISKLSEEEKEQTRAQTAAYRRIEALIREGDLYRISSPFTTNYFCMSVVAKNKSQAYVVCERIHAVPKDFNTYLRLPGLDADALYEIEETGERATGRVLETLGIIAPKLGDYGAFTWHIKKVSL